MAKNPIELRRTRYFKLSSQIAQLDNAQLHALFGNSETNESGTGWGMNHTIVLGQSKIFVKRFPVTSIEYDNLFSTRNFYDLPTSYSYGIGTTGFGVFRELVTHIKTTNWLLEGELANFPLMYHYRIIPFSGRRADNDIRTTLDFLRTKEIIHFDAHFRNILTDGQQTYLTDFGLVLDKSFTLTEDEESFFDQNTFYDCGEVLRNFGHLIRSPYDACSEDEKRRIRKNMA